MTTKAVNRLVNNPRHRCWALCWHTLGDRSSQSGIRAANRHRDGVRHHRPMRGQAFSKIATCGADLLITYAPEDVARNFF